MRKDPNGFTYEYEYYEDYTENSEERGRKASFEKNDLFYILSTLSTTKL